MLKHRSEPEEVCRVCGEKDCNNEMCLPDAPFCMLDGDGWNYEEDEDVNND